MNKLSFLILLIAVTFAACNSKTEKATVENTATTPSKSKVTATKPAVEEGGVAWVSLTEAENMAKKSKRNVLVDVYTPWCGPCKMLDRTTFKDPGVVEILNNNFYPVKFNAEGPDPITFKGKEWSNPNFNPQKTRGRNAQHQLSPFFKVRGYPTMVVMNENMEIIEKITGFKTADQLKEILAKYDA